MWIRRLEKVLTSCLIVAAGGAMAAFDVPQSDQVAGSGFSAKALQVPLSFEKNIGQTGKSVRFLSRGTGRTTYLRDKDMMVVLQPPCGEAHQCQRETLTMSWPGAKESAPTGNNKLQTLSHYLLGNDQEQWQTGIANYEKVFYPQVYPGIDLVFYGTSTHQLEYDFVVAPGADPELIRLTFDGVKNIYIRDDGALVLQMISGEIVQQAPVVYQQAGAEERQAVSGKYRIIGPNTVGFELGHYDQLANLVIDPVVTYSTYLGEASDKSRDIRVSLAGEAYVTGYTDSLDFPVANAVQPENGGRRDVFIGKLNLEGNAFEYATYLGGSESEGSGSAIGPGLAINRLGEVYLTGRTYSSDFPLVNPMQAELHGVEDFFVAKLNSFGDQLIFSTYLGREDSAPNGDSSPTIVVGLGGDIAIQAYTDSPGFPIVNAAQPFHAGRLDTLVMKLDSQASSILWSTYLGGAGDDKGRAVAIDRAGNVWVTGRTDSTDFPMINALQGVSGGLGDIFVTQIASDGSEILFSTYFGGSNTEKGRSIVIDRGGNVYVAGNTQSIDLPVVNAVQGRLAGGGDCFAMKISADLLGVEYLTYLGGRENDQCNALAVDSRERLYITGETESTNFPLRNPIQDELDGTGAAFVTTLGVRGNLSFSSYFGGSGDDTGTAIGIDRQAGIYVIGDTTSSDLELQGEFQATPGGIFITKISNR